MSLVKIQNRFLNDVSWGSFSSCGFSPGDGVDIWAINIGSNLSYLPTFLAGINSEELARANRYRQQRDRDRFIISRGALRTILGKYLNLKPSLVEFEQGENKKPYIKNTALYYNLSHSGDQILVAVSKDEIGIDVEMVDPSFDFQDIINEYFSPEEVDFVNQKQSCERFFTIWTRKEAFTKATGKGLDDNLKLIPCLDGVHTANSDTVSVSADMSVASFIPGEKYLASIATKNLNPFPAFWTVDFSTGF